MKILLVGGGGREHALAWKLAQSPQVSAIYVAPGNGGTAQADLCENVPIAANDVVALLAFARQKQVDFVVVGPEDPLAAGVVDAFVEAGIPAFGPSAAAARLESSKAFARDFMARHGIPSPRFRIFSDFNDAASFLASIDFEVVIKASGLAAGKGVVVPENMDEAEDALRAIMLDRQFGDAGDLVVIEERLRGQEISVLAFVDGERYALMPLAQDHKPVFDGDQGPNTGGMGAFAPAALLTAAELRDVERKILVPAIRGLAADGTPYRGVLYAGLMLTDSGPKVLEFNCRFGDPETQVILPLLDGDLLPILQACAKGELDPHMVRWREGFAACVVAAAPGYPGSYPKNLPITGLDTLAMQPDLMVFHAGTARGDDGVLRTSGGRVLAVTAVSANLDEALRRAYAGIAEIHFEGVHYRRDIGRRANPVSAYQRAGVDIAAGERAVDLMKEAVRSTYGPEVLAGIGAFGGLFDAIALRGADDTILAASTDGVGTKTMAAARMGRYDTIGHDIVNHCTNDILVQGAYPLFFLDYIASARLQPERVAEVVTGIAAACREAGIALLGGETAEMPGIYHDDGFDLVGTVIGVVRRSELIDGSRIQPGDVILGLPSTGLHTNGYSLARRVFDDWDWSATLPGFDQSLGEALLEPHRSYLAEVKSWRRAGIDIKGLAHITGGGIPGNLARTLPAGTAARIEWGSWPVPAIFGLIRRAGQVSGEEMFRVFNMGLGMLAVVSPDHAAAALDSGFAAHRVGQIIPRDLAADPVQIR
ncbi:MAG: phosphoribosylamine--glycine ligase [Caldilineales bacterium]|nr:phosphoribosylamine--glycine ligase [Caldilineales bacterium]